VSAETKKPVRVIRGFKCKSKYAPAEGYRYDGLYVVEKAWRAPGLNEKGFLVCKYIFKVRVAEGAGGGTRLMVLC
jgi:E3 ubiquitin-protein ligase UHRF1